MPTLCGRKRANPPKITIPESSWKETLNQFLKAQGLRATLPRENVAEIIFNWKNHFEVQDLIREVQVKYPDISPATVYRTVKTLCEAGLLNETLQSHSGVTLYEPSHEDHHDHVICIDCGEIFEFHDEELENAQTKAVKKLHFEPVKHRHVIYANCKYLK